MFRCLTQLRAVAETREKGPLERSHVSDSKSGRTGRTDQGGRRLGVHGILTSWPSRMVFTPAVITNSPA